MITATERATATPRRAEHSRIPLSRLVKVELRKSFDTRSGLWLLAGMGIAATLGTGATLLFAPDEELRWGNFTAAIGVPMAILLPLIAILSVTSEWSQRSGLTSFTLVPQRSRIITAKLMAALLVGVTSMLLTFVLGAIGTVAGAAMAGIEQTWDGGILDSLIIVLYQILNMLIGFMLGVLIRNSAGAIVAYFVYSFVLPTLSMLLAQMQDWYEGVQPWIDFNQAQSKLLNDTVTSEQWAHLGVTSVVWLVIPLLVGLHLVLRSEVK